jgi:SAM-dependent methyltransferase
MDLKETDILGDGIGEHWYYHAKSRAVTALLQGLAPSSILDIGAGSAFFSRFLLQHTPAHEAWCVDISYGADSDQLEHGKTIHFRRSVEAADCDLVLLMDVLEHVDDDAGLLRACIDTVPSGATVLISVPAFQFLWSGHDEFLEHKRRYTLRQLEDLVRRCGLHIRRGFYYYAAVFPLAAALRLAQRQRADGEPPASQLRRHGMLVNATLKALCAIERPFMTSNRLGGLTVFCLARKG